MQSAVQEPVRLILLSVLIALFLDIIVIGYHINQINDYSKEMQQYVQKEGGVTKDVQDKGKLLSTNIYQNMFRIKPYPGDPHSSQVNGYGTQVKYMIEAHIPFIANTGQLNLHFERPGQTASQFGTHNPKPNEIVVNLNGSSHLKAKKPQDTTFSDALAKAAISNNESMPTQTTFSFKRPYPAKYEHEGKIVTPNDPRAGKIELTDKKGTKYLYSPETKYLYLFSDPTKKVGHLKPGKYVTTVFMAFHDKGSLNGKSHEESSVTVTVK